MTVRRAWVTRAEGARHLLYRLPNGSPYLWRPGVGQSFCGLRVRYRLAPAGLPACRNCGAALVATERHRAEQAARRAADRQRRATARARAAAAEERP